MWRRRGSDVYVDRTMKTFVFWVVLVLTALLLWQVMRAPKNVQSPEITYSTFIMKAQAGDIASVSIIGSQTEGEYRNGTGRFHLTGPGNPAAFLGILQDKGVVIRFRNAQEANLPLTLVGTWAPLILLAALWLFVIRQIRIQQIRRKDPPEGDREASFGGIWWLGLTGRVLACTHDFRYPQRNAPFRAGKGKIAKLQLVGPKVDPGASNR